jgi:hypothetical protein
MATWDKSAIHVPEDLGRMITLRCGTGNADVDAIIDVLRQDCIALIKGVSASEADQLMSRLAQDLGLMESLELQSGFAEYYGHRRRVGQYYMTVNVRDDFQFVPPHSEGNSFSGMELASFYCYDNSTDGGETIAMNVNDRPDIWRLLREKKRRIKKMSRQFAKHEISRLRGLYEVDFIGDTLHADDEVLSDVPCHDPDLIITEVLARVDSCYSRILHRNVFTLWDSVASPDFDCAQQFEDMLRELGLLRESTPMSAVNMDSISDRHLIHSGVRFTDLFRCKVVYKLSKGDMLVQNNFTWTHSANNWTPGSGVRKIAASFA